LDCEISDWLLQRRLTQQCRIHPAPEGAGILLALYNQQTLSGEKT
jgi:hypothetical protein